MLGGSIVDRARAPKQEATAATILDRRSRGMSWDEEGPPPPQQALYVTKLSTKESVLYLPATPSMEHVECTIGASWSKQAGEKAENENGAPSRR